MAPNLTFEVLYMVITPTITYTGTWGLWLDAGGHDVGAYAIGVMQGLQVLVFVTLIILGQVLALKIWP